MKRVEIKIGDLVTVKGYEKDFGIGLVMNIMTNEFNGQKDIRIKLKDKSVWCPLFTLRKVTYENR
jgi:hypothetical protein